MIVADRASKWNTFLSPKDNKEGEVRLDFTSGGGVSQLRVCVAN